MKTLPKSPRIKSAAQKKTSRKKSRKGQTATPPSYDMNLADGAVLQRKKNKEEQLERKLPIQAKLQIGKLGDQNEQEADAMADQVVQISETLQQKKPEEEEKKLQPKLLVNRNSPLVQKESLEEEDKFLQPQSEAPVQEASPDLESRIHASQGQGQSLDDATRASMEGAFGADFGGVRVHTDQTAVKMNQELGAKAFTVGQDVYFNKENYQPETKDGKRLLGHELTHVVQQSNLQMQIQRNEDGSFTIQDIVYLKYDQDYDSEEFYEILGKRVFEMVKEWFEENEFFAYPFDQQVADRIIYEIRWQEVEFQEGRHYRFLIEVPIDTENVEIADEGESLEVRIQSKPIKGYVKKVPYSAPGLEDYSEEEEDAVEIPEEEMDIEYILENLDGRLDQFDDVLAAAEFLAKGSKEKQIQQIRESIDKIKGPLETALETKDEIETAARFLYLAKLAYEALDNEGGNSVMKAAEAMGAAFELAQVLADKTGIGPLLEPWLKMGTLAPWVARYGRNQMEYNLYGKPGSEKSKYMPRVPYYSD